MKELQRDFTSLRSLIYEASGISIFYLASRKNSTSRGKV
jgi:hypothetical protein